MNNKEIDITEIIKKLLKKRTLLIKFSFIGIISGILYAFSIPKEYTVEVLLAPESSSGSNSNSLSGMASAFLGVNNINSSNNDALNLQILPEIVESTPFILDLYNSPINDKNNTKMLLSEYIVQEKEAWWNYIIKFPISIINYISSALNSDNNSQDDNKINGFKLSPKEKAILTKITKSINVSIDKKTGIVSIKTTLQDPNASATTANIVTQNIKKYITEYRVQKTKENLSYLTKLREEKKNEYYKIQEKYAAFIDSNRNIISERNKAESERIGNDMQLAYKIYSEIATKTELEKAKLQENSPVFAILEPASIPTKASFPNKTFIIICFFLLSTIIGCLWIIFNDHLKTIITKIC